MGNAIVSGATGAQPAYDWFACKKQVAITSNRTKPETKLCCGRRKGHCFKRLQFRKWGERSLPPTEQQEYACSACAPSDGVQTFYLPIKTTEAGRPTCRSHQAPEPLHPGIAVDRSCQSSSKGKSRAAWLGDSLQPGHAGSLHRRPPEQVNDEIGLAMNSRVDGNASCTP